ncbi:class I SAM-dependent methyltransferase [Lysinibacillus capsici]|uniref:class I SAM-dependent methyltransferase n=1 Tax=Lysinibacillus TaxID=400634 RepID=UPI00214CC130|nr:MULTISPECIES: class I SAM-dependent methyltransferase [Lysinibacillus]UUV25144.1 class I SAM-dependent methyltransferase [Lysinibacillus sp. FN11]UYB48016.1 class I SAM-dependent methyltransferase [Lysinibacillus capsici]
MKKNYLDDYSEAYSDSFAYSLDNELMLNWYPKRVLNHVTGESILELGLGHGYTSVIFSKSFKKHVVVDGSLEIISDFLQKHKEAESMNIVHSYFEEFETDEKFDVIVMGFILEHVENPDLILEKYKKMLKPNGTVYIAVPNSDALNKRFGYEAGLINNMSELTEADLQLGHKRIYNLEKLKDVCIRNGYCIKHVEGIFLKPITTQQIKDLELSKEILNSMLKVGINYPELCAAILVGICLENK